MSYIDVANTILEQLGGQARLKMMIGASNFIARNEGLGGLSFRLPATLPRPRMNMIKIMLNARDLYDIEFLDIRANAKNGFRMVAEAKDIYNDQLREVIERNTGLV